MLNMSYTRNITEVFTPRRSEINEAMYVHRPHFEKLILRSLKRNSHSLIFGESGNGKSWLFKKILSENNIPYVIANCANASRYNSITKEICNSLIETGTVLKLGFNEEKAAEIGAFFAKGALKHNGNYELTQEDPLLLAFKMFSENKNKKKILVLDNLESIFRSEKLMIELANIIILLDDSRYAQYNINILIVGIPNGVIQYFRETKNVESVANRIQEVQRIPNLTFNQTEEIIQKGFSILQIELTTNDLDVLASHIFNVTLGIAQRVHEYCEELAYKIEDNNWEYTDTLLSRTDFSWLSAGLRQCYQVIESHLNSRKTTVSRRNQIIYCIGKLQEHQFDVPRIEKEIKREFSSTIPKTNMGLGSILNKLSSSEKPLLKKNETNNSYYILDPRYLMCIRVSLYKHPSTEVVIKKNFCC